MSSEFESRKGNWLSLLWQSVYEDFLMAFHGLFINRIASSIFVPRIIRFPIYKLARMQIHTANVFYGVKFSRRLVTLGKRTFVNTNVIFEDNAPITIGDDCQIGMEVLFVTSHHQVHGGKISKVPEPRPISVGDRCWIGARALILPGVTIASDCVIAAGAVVTRDIEHPGVYAGVPARMIKNFSEPAQE